MYKESRLLAPSGGAGFGEITAKSQTISKGELAVVKVVFLVGTR